MPQLARSGGPAPDVPLTSLSGVAVGPAADRPLRVGGIEVTELAEGLMVRPAGSPAAQQLNNTASVILELCDGHRTVNQIAAALAEAFGLDADPLAEVTACVAGLRSAGILADAGQAPGPADRSAIPQPAEQPGPGRVPAAQFLIPVWNDLLSLVLCLPTVLEIANQVVLYDDGSTDGSAEYVEAMARQATDTEVIVLRSAQQRGWTRARQVLAGYADPGMLRAWADADHLFIPKAWPRFVAELDRVGALYLGEYEVWGDHRHTTHIGFHGDICHLALRPGDARLCGWTVVASGSASPVLAGQAPPWVGPLVCFHMNCYKTDERLAIKGEPLRQFNLRHGGPGDPGSPAAAGQEPGDVHAAAMRTLFANWHRPVGMPAQLADYLEQRIPEELRFTMTASDRAGNEAVTAELERMRQRGFAPPGPTRPRVPAAEVPGELLVEDAGADLQQ